MTWATYQDARGRGWAFDGDGAALVLRQTTYNRIILERARTITIGHGLMPTTTEVEVNFDGIRRETQTRTRAIAEALPRDLVSNPDGLYDWLVRVREDGIAAGDAYTQMCRDAQHATALAIDSNVAMWQNAESAARFVRNASASILFVGATILSGGAAAAVGAGGAGLTFTGNTQDNLAAGQSTRRALSNAAVSTSIAVITNVLIPRGMAAASSSMMGAGVRLTMGQNVALGLVSVQANIAGDALNTALTPSDAANAVAAGASSSMERQIGARSGFEIGSMVFQAWLQSRGIPASAFLARNEQVATSLVGGALSALGDRFVAAAADTSLPARGVSAPNLDLVLAGIQRLVTAEAYVREVAMRPA